MIAKIVINNYNKIFIYIFQDNNPDTAEEPVISSAWYSNKNKYHSNKQQNAFPPLQSQQENHRIEVQTTNNTQT